MLFTQTHWHMGISLKTVLLMWLLNRGCRCNMCPTTTAFRQETNRHRSYTSEPCNSASYTNASPPKRRYKCKDPNVFGWWAVSLHPFARQKEQLYILPSVSYLPLQGWMGRTWCLIIVSLCTSCPPRVNLTGLGSTEPAEREHLDGRTITSKRHVGGRNPAPPGMYCR